MAAWYQRRYRQFDSHRVTVAETAEAFVVKPNQTLLQAALDAGLNWSFGCRVGICGSCRCQVLDGQVTALTDFGSVLDRRQVDAGHVLACRALLESDAVVTADALTAAAGAAGDLQATVAEVRQLTPLVLELNVTLEQPFANGYTAGQYARLSASVPAQLPPRCFSFATACRGDARLRFYIRQFPEGQWGEWLTQQDCRGSSLWVSQPLGGFTLRDSGRAALFICGGTGLAPILAMLEEMASHPARRRPVRLVYAARDQAHLFAQATITRLKQAWPDDMPFEFMPVLSREPATSRWSGLRGHIFDHLPALTAGFEGADAYLCGPPGLVDAAQLYLVKAGWDLTDVHTDRFLPAF